MASKSYGDVRYSVTVAVPVSFPTKIDRRSLYLPLAISQVWPSGVVQVASESSSSSANAGEAYRSGTVTVVDGADAGG